MLSRGRRYSMYFYSPMISPLLFHSIRNRLNTIIQPSHSSSKALLMVLLSVDLHFACYMQMSFFFTAEFYVPASHGRPISKAVLTWRLRAIPHGELHLDVEPVGIASLDEGGSQPIVDVVGEDVTDGVSAPIVDLFPLIRPRHFLPPRPIRGGRVRLP